MLPDPFPEHQLQASTHPGNISNQQYMDWLITDARKVNPNIKVLVMLGYDTNNQLTQIFSGSESQWPQQAAAFANNLVTYLRNYNLDGFDVDWEAPLSSNGTPHQFALLFSAIRKAFNAQGQKYYLTLSPASVGTLDANTVNEAFDFVNLQLYSGFTHPEQFLAAGVKQSKLAYGAKFEVNGNTPYQNAQQAAAFYAPNCKKQLSYSVFTQWRLNSNNFQYEQAQQMILYQLIHGLQGPSFDDTPIIRTAGNPPISQITVRSGDVLDAIQVTNTGAFEGNPVGYTLPQHGGNGGSAGTFQIPQGDAVVQVSGYTGVWYGWNCVLQISFKTRNGNTYGPFGTKAHASSQTQFSFEAPQGQSIIAFSGSVVNVPQASGGTTDIIASLNVSYG